MGHPVDRLQIQYFDASGPSKCRRCRVPVRMFEGELKCPNCFQFVPGAHLGAVLVDVPLMRDEDIEVYTNERRNELKNAMLLGMPPAKEPGFLCAYCASIDKCNPNERAEEI